MKGFAGIFIIIGILALAFLGFLFSQGFLNPQTPQTPSETPYSFSTDPKYKEVKDKYNLSEEQLQILSTVNPEDNE